MMKSDVEVYIRQADRQVIGSTTTWTSLNLTSRRNDVGRWTLVTGDPEDARLLSPVVNTDGAIIENRGVILRRTDRSGNGRTIASGWLSAEPTIEHSGGQTTWTFGGWDDTYLLARGTCWPLPTADIESQTDSHDVRTGPASNRIRDYFLANIQQRMGMSGATGGSQLDLGPVGTSRARFINMLALAQLIASRNLNFEVRQRDSDNALFLHQWLPVDKRFDVQFTPSAGTALSWSRNSTESQGNRLIIGMGGEGSARQFRQYTHAQDRGTWGTIEQFQDRRDLDPESSTWFDEAIDSAAEFFDENIARSSFSIDVSGSPDSIPFIDFAPGDLVRAYVDQDDDGQPIGLVDDLIEEVAVTWSAEGEEGTVKIGADAELSRKQEARLRQAMRRLSYMEARR